MPFTCRYCKASWKSDRGLRKHVAECALSQLQTAGLPQEAAPATVPDDTNGEPLDIEMREPEPHLELPEPAQALPEVLAEPETRRPVRKKRKTWKLIENEVAPPPLPIPEPPEAAEALPEVQMLPPICTLPSPLGVYRVYPQRPTHNPDSHVVFASELTGNTDDEPIPPLVPEEVAPPSEQPWAPFLNATVARLMSWFHSGSDKKSKKELDSLVNNVLLHDDFNAADLKQFSCTREHKRIDDFLASSSSTSNKSTPPLPISAAWEKHSVTIPLPAPKVKIPEARAPTFEVKDIHIRPLLSVMKEAFQGPEFQDLHLTPFEECWDPEYVHDPAAPSSQHHGYPVRQPFSEVPQGHQRLYAEVYNTQKMMDTYRSLPVHPTLETVVVAFMFWSDSTHLANFGTASLWPLYTFFGNCSKYLRAQPTAGHCHHQAYIPSLPDTVNDVYMNSHGHPPRPAYLTYLKRELMHAVWRLLLNAEFIHAYIHGLILKCYDAIERILFPRFFSYGADYPEKILLALIKYLGGCPCPRCSITKAKIRNLGQKRDMAFRLNPKRRRFDTPELQETIEKTRKFIFMNGNLPNGTRVDSSLKELSLVPHRNAFSVLRPHGLNFYELFVPDLLHEFELGVWKAIFTHLIRILHVRGNDQVAILNDRFRKVPTFGRAIIRQFHSDAASMKKLAARDFEDLLQCVIPVIEGLFPTREEKIVLDLLFSLAQWHFLAKLRLHTDTTLDLLSLSTTDLGNNIRRFADQVCPQYETEDLPREVEARARRRRKADRTKSADTTSKSADATASAPRTLNLSTYKLHALGDYVEAIRNLGTTESWSTQIGELEHRYVKRLYARTNKNKYTSQIAQHEQRERLLRALRHRMDDIHQPTEQADDEPDHSSQETLLPPEPSLQHHFISSSHRQALSLSGFIDDHEDDIAFKDFLPKLKAHLLGRLLGIRYTGDEHEFSGKELSKVIIANDRLYAHKVLRVFYTSYDSHRCYDVLNPRRHADFITTSHEDNSDDDNIPSHPFWYGRILKIFSAVVHHPCLESAQTMHFLWIRWYGRDLDHAAGFGAKRLLRLGFVDLNDKLGVAFLDPTLVLRAVHIIPAFAHGLAQEPIEPSFAIQLSEPKAQWKWYYLGLFSDRDTAMRHLGGGVGHHNSPTTTDPIDVETLQETSGPEDINNDLDNDSENESALPELVEANVPGVVDQARVGLPVEDATDFGGDDAEDEEIASEIDSDESSESEDEEEDTNNVSATQFDDDTQMNIHDW